MQHNNNQARIFLLIKEAWLNNKNKGRVEQAKAILSYFMIKSQAGISKLVIHLTCANLKLNFSQAMVVRDR